MSAPTINGVPKYLRHAQRGGARVYIDGEEIYLGPYGSPVSREKYDRLIVEWLAAGRRLPASYRPSKDLTVAEVIIPFMQHAKTEYSRNGELAREYYNLKPPLRVLQQLYGTVPAAEFGPKALKVVREALIHQHLHPRGESRPCDGDPKPSGV